MIICSEELSCFCVAGWVRETYRKPQKESCWWSFLSWPCWGKLFPAPTITKVSSVHLHCLCEMVPLSRVRYAVFTGLLSFVRCGLPLAIFIFSQWKCRELFSSWLWKETWCFQDDCQVCEYCPMSAKFCCPSIVNGSDVKMLTWCVIKMNFKQPLFS